MPTPSLPNPALQSGSRWTALVKAGFLLACFVVLYWNNLVRLYYKTMPFIGDPNWSHSICIPIIGLYYLYLHRDELEATPIEPLLMSRITLKRILSAVACAGVGLVLAKFAQPVFEQVPGLSRLGTMVSLGGYFLLLFPPLVVFFDWGIGTLLGGLFLTAYGIWGSNDFLWDFGGIVTLFGMVLTLCGWKIMRIAWFPIVFLVCALPWPPIVYSQIASPLQVLSARVAVLVLQLTGADASYSGTRVLLPQFAADGTRLQDRALDVATACAGLRSLMTFISIGGAVAFLSDRALWQRLLIVASAVPIAVLCNVFRVSGLGILDLYVDKHWSEGFAHQFAGMVMLLPAFVMLLIVCWVLDRLFIEEVDREGKKRRAGLATRKKEVVAGSPS